MSEGNSRAIPVRMNEDVISKLDEMASNLGLTRSFLMRFAINKLVEDFGVRGELELTRRYAETKHEESKK